MTFDRKTGSTLVLLQFLAFKLLRKSAKATLHAKRAVAQYAQARARADLQRNRPSQADQHGALIRDGRSPARTSNADLGRLFASNRRSGIGCAKGRVIGRRSGQHAAERLWVRYSSCCHPDSPRSSNPRQEAPPSHDGAIALRSAPKAPIRLRGGPAGRTAGYFASPEFETAAASALYLSLSVGGVTSPSSHRDASL